MPLADSQLVMLIRWLEVSDAGAASKWHDQWVALQGAGQRGPAEIRSQAKNMLATLDGSIVPQVRSRTLDDAQLRKLLKSIVSDARGAHVGDFSDAEQDRHGRIGADHRAVLNAARSRFPPACEQRWTSFMLR